MEQAFKINKIVSEVNEEGQAILVLPKSSKFIMQSRAITRYHHILNSQETNILFKNMFSIFSRIYELQLHKRKIRKKLKSCLNSSKMAETNRQLNQSVSLNDTIGGLES